jgi:hypothetical protein
MRRRARWSAPAGRRTRPAPRSTRTRGGRPSRRRSPTRAGWTASRRWPSPGSSTGWSVWTPTARSCVPRCCGTTRVPRARPPTSSPSWARRSGRTRPGSCRWRRSPGRSCAGSPRTSPRTRSARLRCASRTTGSPGSCGARGRSTTSSPTAPTRAAPPTSRASPGSTGSTCWNARSAGRTCGCHGCSDPPNPRGTPRTAYCSAPAPATTPRRRSGWAPARGTWWSRWAPPVWCRP